MSLLFFWGVFVVGYLLGWVSANGIRKNNPEPDNDDLRRFRGRVKRRGQAGEPRA